MTGIPHLGGLAAGGSSTPAGTPADSPEARQGAAAQFEALLISQLLQSMRSSAGGWLGGDDQSTAALQEHAEQMFAQLLAAQGGFGLARLVTQGLERNSQQPPATPGPHQE
jgi:Rod binding domain-containing protein